jgi:hypothetical protein
LFWLLIFVFEKKELDYNFNPRDLDFNTILI